MFGASLLTLQKGNGTDNAKETSGKRDKRKLRVFLRVMGISPGIRISGSSNEIPDTPGPQTENIDIDAIIPHKEELQNFLLEIEIRKTVYVIL
ncbi:hypothetical protein [Bilophila wadsworthia]|uniref:hypothetical protein n=1 Tax=Bilophila wadsworthia TaxID=35833 RepID=UPI00242D5431|nr:hypothetical protein [Bilophila wadsworthia]